MVQNQIVLAAVAEQQSHYGIQPVLMYSGKAQLPKEWEPGAPGEAAEGSGMAELHFPAAVIPQAHIFPILLAFFWVICSHNRL